LGLRPAPEFEAWFEHHGPELPGALKLIERGALSRA
jgi:hypothetical protein